jgi:3-oxoacyl-(acyl-carrier-protein) synthase
MREGIILPTLNYIPDPSLPEAWIPAECGHHDHNLTLLNSFGFGGTNVSFAIGTLPRE